METQPEAAFASDSDYRAALAAIVSRPPSNPSQQQLMAEWLDTPLGPMLAMADEEQLLLLEFVERRGLEAGLRRLAARYAIVSGSSAPLESIRDELTGYFAGELREFTTPVRTAGTDFQKRVWRELQRIPYGETISYLELARRVDRPKAFRAVAQANGANQLAVIIPCHRVINANGRIGGYGGGVPRKEDLLRLEMESKAVPAT